MTSHHNISTLPVYLILCLGFFLGLPSCVEGVAEVSHADSGNQVGPGLLSTVNKVGRGEGIGNTVLRYKPIFNALKDAWYGEQHDEPTPLSNNHPSRNQIAPGASQLFVFPLSELRLPRTTEARQIPPVLQEEHLEDEPTHQELRKRSGLHRLYVTLSICGQPVPDSSQDDIAPGLEIYASTTGVIASGQRDEVHQLTTEEGFAYLINDYADDVSFEIRAPAITGYDGSYTYEITASVDELYTSYYDFPSLRHMDSDHQAGFFVTNDLTNSSHSDHAAIDAWMKTGSPFTIFVHQDDDLLSRGVRRSYCGLAENAQVQLDSEGVETGMNALNGNAAKQQFYIPGLTPGTTYHAILGLPSNYSRRGAGAPTGGGLVWRATEFQTNSGNSCQILHNLSFCDIVSYAAPSPSNGTVNATQLGIVYDNFASATYQNFSYSLQQIACETDPGSQYSLATNCSQCEAAYKQWVCAVTIPRCAESGSNATGTISRNASDSSRNQIVNDLIQPAPYSELPPCGDLCFGLVQNCPYALSFKCPYPYTWYFNQSYGYLGDDPNNPTCNGFNKMLGVSSATSIRPSVLYALASMLALSASFLLGVV